MFTKNLQLAGLLKETTLGTRVISVEQMMDESDGAGAASPAGPRRILPAALDSARGQPPPAPASMGTDPQVRVNPATPTVHIDVNIHIDASASGEQIDRMFASMAKHFGMGKAGDVESS